MLRLAHVRCGLEEVDAQIDGTWRRAHPVAISFDPRTWEDKLPAKLCGPLGTLTTGVTFSAMMAPACAMVLVIHGFPLHPCCPNKRRNL